MFNVFFNSLGEDDFSQTLLVNLMKVVFSLNSNYSLQTKLKPISVLVIRNRKVFTYSCAQLVQCLK